MGVLTVAPLPGDASRAYVPISQLASEYPRLNRLPRSLLVLLESAMRGHLAEALEREHVDRIAGWVPQAPRDQEVSFFVNRILVPDSTGIPLLADLAAMRSAAERWGEDPARIEPMVRVDMVIDHSVQIDAFGSLDALARNTDLEFQRNEERFRFIKWADAAFERFHVVPPGNGICHQINLEQISRVAWETGGVVHPDLLLGCDSHTTMVNGLGILGWGVGGIEAEAAMLGQPVTFLLPDVVGVRLKGSLTPGVTTTDLVLTITERLRAARVVGKFVEFIGPGAAALSVPERATLANMAPEYGATVGFFPVDEATLRYLEETGRDPDLVQLVRRYYEAQGMFGMPDVKDIDFSEVIEVDLSLIVPSVAGPRRPQDRIALTDVKARFAQMLSAPISEGGFERGSAVKGSDHVEDGDVVLAAITSCTNTSNPQVMIAAGLLARNAVAAGLEVHGRVKTSFSPGSRAVAKYMEALDLLKPMSELGFDIAAFGCGTCIGNSGPLDPIIEADLATNGSIAAAVLSGNRNFEARVHPAIKANFLASPPLVVAYAIAGRIGIDFETEALGGKVMLRDIWPDPAEVARLTAVAPGLALSSEGGPNGRWAAIPEEPSIVYDWPSSTYIKEPPFFRGDGAKSLLDPILRSRALLILGDSVTTDHISPGGAIKPSSDAGRWLIDAGVPVQDFNTFAARRGNHEIMIRGTFGNVRLRNRMVPGVEGGFTRHYPSGDQISVFDAALRYQADGVPAIVLAGREYGTGSSRDWAAKGTALLGVRAVLAQSFERIHRGNLAGLGVVPLQFLENESADTFGFDGSETFDIGLSAGVLPGDRVTVRASRSDGTLVAFSVVLRVDTETEMGYLREGGIMRFVLERSLQ